MAKRKIAIVARAPSSRYLCPFEDESWEIWTLSPMGAPGFCDLPRWDRWYEIHNVVEKNIECPGYIDWMATQDNLWIREPHPQLPNGQVYPLEEIQAFFQTGFAEEFNYYNNSVSLMMAHALWEMLKDGEPYKRHEDYHLALWGVDMCQHTEYGSQAPSCELFLGWAAGAGVKMHVTPVCDLIKTARVYGIEDQTAFEAKMAVHSQELESKLKRHHADLNEAKHAHVGAVAAHQELSQLLASMNGDPAQAKQKAALEKRLHDIQLLGERTKARISDLDSDIKMVTGALEENRYVRQWQQ